jgi:hypothetical protein
LTFPSSFAFPISRRESPPDYVESPARDIYLAPPDRRDRAACVATIAVLDARATSLARPFRVQPSRTNLRARAVARVSVEIASSARTAARSFKNDVKSNSFFAAAANGFAATGARARSNRPTADRAKQSA